MPIISKLKKINIKIKVATPFKQHQYTLISSCPLVTMVDSEIVDFFVLSKLVGMFLLMLNLAKHLTQIPPV